MLAGRNGRTGGGVGMRRLFAIVAVLVATALCAGCSRGSVPTPIAAPKADLAAEAAWIRTTTGTKDPSMTAAFMTILNSSEATVQLTSVDCPGAGIVQLHEMVMQSGKMVMQEVKGGIPVPATKATRLAPGGYHIMLMKLQKGFAIGDMVDLTLHFSDGGSLVVEAPVKQDAAKDLYRSPVPTTTATS
jgi:copper(I)-binding protein